MSIPGFTAEASLYKVGHGFNWADTSLAPVSPARSAGSVEPAVAITPNPIAFCSRCEAKGGICVCSLYSCFCW